MKLYKGNRVDGEFEMEPAEIARLFAKSPQAETDWPTERALRVFMTDPAGPINASWEEGPDFQRTLELALDALGGGES